MVLKCRGRVCDMGLPALLPGLVHVEWSSHVEGYSSAVADAEGLPRSARVKAEARSLEGGATSDPAETCVNINNLRRFVFIVF